MASTIIDNAMRDALRKFSAANGRTWRRKLIDAWACGADLGCELQRARNVIGPSGLYRIKAESLG